MTKSFKLTVTCVAYDEWANEFMTLKVSDGVDFTFLHFGQNQGEFSASSVSVSRFWDRAPSGPFGVHSAVLMGVCNDMHLIAIVLHDMMQRFGVKTSEYDELFEVPVEIEFN